MDFFIFQCSGDKELYLASTTRTIPLEATKLCGGEWILFTAFEGSGEFRLAFPTEPEIEVAVAKKGYLIFRAGVYSSTPKVADPQPPPGRRGRPRKN